MYEIKIPKKLIFRKADNQTARMVDLSGPIFDVIAKKKIIRSSIGYRKTARGNGILRPAVVLVVKFRGSPLSGAEGGARVGCYGERRRH